MFQFLVSFVQGILFLLGMVGCAFAVVIVASSVNVCVECLFSAQTRQDTFGDKEWIGFVILVGGSCFWIAGCLFAFFSHTFF